MSLVIPIFIPHEGCPHNCLFCNQHSISGHVAAPVTGAEVGETIHTWLERAKPENRGQVQVAFYGGSFTGLPAARQTELLAAVQPFYQQGLVREIRLSTRPDYIDRDRLDLLCRHRVSIIELGVQSCDDGVLRRAGRGHSRADIEQAVRLIRERNIRLGIQLMLGLPEDRFRHPAAHRGDGHSATARFCPPLPGAGPARQRPGGIVPPGRIPAAQSREGGCSRRLYEKTV